MSGYIIAPYTIGTEPHPKHTIILDQLCARPQWTQTPMTATQRRANFALLLSDPNNGVYEVWQGANLVGILTLHGVIPGVEAVFHFAFFDSNLVGKRQLLLQFIRSCFTDFGFQRLVMLIPEPVDTLIRFARTKLGFRYEGEVGLAGHKALAGLGMENPHVWVAKQGSRKEHCHWQDGVWHDLVALRLLSSEVPATL